MAKLYWFLVLITQLFAACNSSVNGQAEKRYRILFEDKEKKETPSVLLQKAIELNAALPNEWRDSFAVFNTEYTVLRQHFTNKEILQIGPHLKDSAALQAPYYLSFFWLVFERHGRLKGHVEINMNLPQTGELSCLNDLRSYAVHRAINNYAESLKKKDFQEKDYIQVELAVMDSLISHIQKIRDCCHSSSTAACQQCYSGTEARNSFNELNNRIGHVKLHKNTNGYSTPKEKKQTLTGPNFSIVEMAPVYIEWEGKKIRLSHILSSYFQEKGKGVFWETLIVPKEICGEEAETVLRQFIYGETDEIIAAIKPEKIPEYAHKLIASIDAAGNLWFKVATEDSMVHPISLTNYKISLIGQ
ncbi:MAG: hypothetical protein HRU41_41550 [Saprospiraceae bacterium]|nr:hypothetical protein [Saprospiraceae bacterium]